ncbi:hypothetical protein HNQ05_001983 [Oceanithermus desulfurans]|uniref:Uncharacterized protein n=1 Tax=Oceanithermus desulfurans TaxID=227924 RepID=A0ABR6P3I8_9DEIN|nr:hypothetical protein [Oceanithermus desulfurans]
MQVREMKRRESTGSSRLWGSEERARGLPPSSASPLPLLVQTPIYYVPRTMHHAPPLSVIPDEGAAWPTRSRIMSGTGPEPCWVRTRGRAPDARTVTTARRFNRNSQQPKDPPPRRSAPRRGRRAKEVGGRGGKAVKSVAYVRSMRQPQPPPRPFPGEGAGLTVMKPWMDDAAWAPARAGFARSAGEANYLPFTKPKTHPRTRRHFAVEIRGPCWAKGQDRR